MCVCVICVSVRFNQKHRYMLNGQYINFLQGTGLLYCEGWQHKPEIDKRALGQKPQLCLSQGLGTHGIRPPTLLAMFCLIPTDRGLYTDLQTHSNT